MTRTVARWLALVVGVAVGLRVMLAVAHPFEFPDSADYEQLARAIVAHQPYAADSGIASRMPGYPIFLAGVYGLGGNRVAALCLQAVMGGAVAWLAYVIGRRAGEAVGMVAAALTAVDPLGIGFSAALLTEAPYTLLLMLSLWAAIRLIETGNFWWWVRVGVLWGIGVYFRASALWGLVAVGGWIVAGAMWGKGGAVAEVRRRAQTAIIGLLVAMAIVLVLLWPWCSRNYRVFGNGFFRLTTLEGISLYEAVYPPADGGPQQHLITQPPEFDELNEAQVNDAWAARGWGYVRQEPGRILKLAVIKIGRTWSPWLNAVEFRSSVLRWGLAVWSIPLYLLAIIGVSRGGLPTTFNGVLLMPVLYFTAVHALFLGSVRYRAPLMPIVCIFAAVGVVEVLKWVKGRQTFA